MSYNSFSSIGNPINISKANIPTPTALTYVSSTTNIINISFTMQSIPGVTTYLPNVGSGSTGTPSAYAVKNLASNTSYSITLVAVNSGSKSIPSSPPLTRLTLPDPPTSLTYTANTLEANRFTCSFTAPSGSEALTYNSSSGIGAGTPAAYIISSLLSNTSYNITLTARNSAGDSTSSTPALPILTLPDPPTALSYLASSVTANQIGISFTAPSGTVTGYVPSSGGGTKTTSPFTVTGLTSNTSYTITLRAKNTSGNSIVSTTSVSKLTLPDPPTSLAYVANSVTANQIGISFTAPSGTISSYSPSTGGGTGNTSPFTVTGLASNTLHTITLSANNATGGSISSTTSVTKLTLPGPPTIGTATITNKTNVSVSFTAPSGSGTITGYTVTSNPGGFTGTGSSSPITVTNTYVATTGYKFTVTATNASGTSVSSGESNIVTPNAITYYNGLVWTVYYNYFGAGGYYNGSNLTIAPINQVWGASSNTAITMNPGVTVDMTNLLTSTSNIVNNGDITGITRHRFSVEWVGYFKPNETGTWTFSTASDDASYLWIDNDSSSYATSGYNASTNPQTATVYNGFDQGVTNRSGTAVLTSGRYYFMRIQFGENGGGYDMQVTHKAPSASTASYNFSGYAYNTVRAS